MFSKQVALIVDDSVQVQRIVMRILRDDLNFGRILVASNGKQALQYFENEHIDWIFSDWDMPTMGGHELVQALRMHPKGRDIPFILMTGHSDKKTLETAVASGITDFVAKPFSPAVLSQKIRRITAATERRVAARIATKESYPAQIMFCAGGAKYNAELVDISASGCLLRSEPLHKGGTVFDEAKLTLKLISNIITVKSTTIRIAVDSETAKTGKNILIAFQFKAEGDVLNSIKLFITQQQAKESDTDECLNEWA